MRSLFCWSILFAALPLFAQEPPAPASDALQQLLKHFPAADADRNGTLTPQEARAYREKMQGSAVARGGRPALPAPSHANAAYGEHERQVLDFWKADSRRPTPVLVYIHGGGFVGGDKGQVSPSVVAACTAAGISFASINYRYSTQAPYPGPMLDGARAIQFLRSKAGEWSIDPQRIGAFGGSAGAGIALWVGFHDDLANPKSADPVARHSSRLSCIGSAGGQSSYDPVQIREWLGGRVWEHPALLSLYGVATSSDFQRPAVRRLAFEASAINHLTPDDPPVFMRYDEPDRPLPSDAAPGMGIHHPKFGHMLKARMDGLGIEAVYRHSEDGLQPSPPEAMLEWLKKRLLEAKAGG